MNINNNLPPKKAIISLIFGFIGILLVLPLSLFDTRIPALNFLLYAVGGGLGITGLILGIKSLKVVKSITGVVGIILCIIVILIWIYLLYVYAFFFGYL